MSTNESDIEFVELNSNEKTIAFTVKHADLAIINSLRRTALADLNNVGFHFDPNEHHDAPTTNVIQNDTPLHNEIIMHRMSLIPIHMTKDEIDKWVPDSYEFILDVTNSTGFREDVTSEKIRVRHIESDQDVPETIVRKWFPCDPFTKDYILITKLNNTMSSRIHLTAKAIHGDASMCVSFGVLSRFSVEFVVDEDLAQKNLVKQFKEYTKTKESLTGVDKSTSEETFKTFKTFEKQFKSLERERWYSRNKYLEPNLFKITIDSECALTPKEIFNESIETLKRNLVEQIELAKNTKLEIINNDSFMSVVIPSSNHTIGNLVQSTTYNHAIRKDPNNSNSSSLLKHKLTYVGYNIPHPLDSVLLFKFKGDNVTTIDDARQCYNDMLNTTLSEINEFKMKWNTFSSTINT